MSSLISSSLIKRTIPFHNRNLFFTPKTQSLHLPLNNRATTNILIFAEYSGKAPPEIPNVPRTKPPSPPKEDPVLPSREPEIDPAAIPPEIVVDPPPTNPKPDIPTPPLSPPGPETPLPPKPPDVVPPGREVEPPRPPGPEIVPPTTFPPEITPPTAPGIGPTVIF